MIALLQDATGELSPHQCPYMARKQEEERVAQDNEPLEGQNNEPQDHDNGEENSRRATSANLGKRKQRRVHNERSDDENRATGTASTSRQQLGRPVTASAKCPLGPCTGPSTRNEY